MKPISVLIVDDVTGMRQMLTQMLAGDAGVDVIGACDSVGALAKIRKLQPDVLILDSESPGTSNLGFLEQVMMFKPMPVIMVSALSPSSAEATLRALELGAFDYLERPEKVDDIALLMGLQQRLQALVRAAAKARIIPNFMGIKQERALHYKAKREGLPIIALGASTGGVEALRGILSRMPIISPPMVIAQHMPIEFTGQFADRLNAVSPVTVVEAVDGARLQNGYAILAPGNKHLTINRHENDYYCQLEPSRENIPSIDKLFNSVADQAGKDAIGVLLSGMGHDGAAGLYTMHEHGAHTLVQNEATSTVFSMPGAALEMKAATLALPLHEIPKHLLDISKKQNAAWLNTQA